MEGASDREAKRSSLSKSCLMANLSPKQAAPFLEYAKSIPDDDLYTEDDQYGRELESHVTVLYGLKTTDAGDVSALFRDRKAIHMRFGRVSIFENDDKPYDVVKVDVESEDLQECNALLRSKLEYENDHPDYHPHLTLAYVKKGLGKKYDGDSQFIGKHAEVTTLVFSTPDNTKTKFEIGEHGADEDP